MFGASNPCGQGSSSSDPDPFGTQTLFGQNNDATIGASSPIGAQTGTSTGVFGTSTPSFGEPSAPAFGNLASPFAGCTPDASSSTSTPRNYPRCQDYEQGPKGSLVRPYAPTELSGTLLMSICGMPFYEGKSHEELRWEDYQQDENNGEAGDALVEAIEKLKLVHENDGGNKNGSQVEQRSSN